MGVSINTRKAYSEIDEFLGLLSEEQRNKIPKKLREFFRKEKDQEYRKGINSNIAIKNQDLKEETLAIIALLNLQYWCENEIEKQRLKQVYAQNEGNYQKSLQEKYNPDDIFKKKKEDKLEYKTSETTAIAVVQEEKWYKKIFNIIKGLFHRN